MFVKNPKGVTFLISPLWGLKKKTSLYSFFYINIIPSGLKATSEVKCLRSHLYD